MQKRTWAEISLANIEHNYKALRSLLPVGTKYLGVVKADSYGHGAVRVSGLLQELGADYLSVACFDEAAELRRAGISLPILIFGPTPPELSGELATLNITQTVYSLESALEYSAALRGTGKRLRVHIKADTGMSRLGFYWGMDAAADIARAASSPGLEAEGIYTHFADSDGTTNEYTDLQFSRFTSLIKKLENEYNISFAICHCDNSAGVIKYPETHLDMVRGGLAQYGMYPSPEMKKLIDLRPAMTVKTVITQIRALPTETPVSYGLTFKTMRESRIAAVPIGYADGLHRVLSNKADFMLNGKRAPVVGRICMDMCMLDVTDIPEASVGDTVTVFGQGGVPVDEHAELAGTISYELVCAVSRRVPRIYDK